MPLLLLLSLGHRCPFLLTFQVIVTAPRKTSLYHGVPTLPLVRALLFHCIWDSIGPYCGGRGRLCGYSPAILGSPCSQSKEGCQGSLTISVGEPTSRCGCCIYRTPRPRWSLRRGKFHPAINVALAAGRKIAGFDPGGLLFLALLVVQM